MKLSRAKILIEELMVSKCEEYLVKWSSRMTRTFGECHRGCAKNNYIGTLWFSIPLVELNSEEVVRDVMLHEIAHAITTGGHDREFYNACRALGCKAERCYDNSVVIPKRTGYVYKCPNCEVERIRRGKLRKSRACGDCCNKYNNSKYSKDYELLFVRKE